MNKGPPWAPLWGPLLFGNEQCLNLHSPAGAQVRFEAGVTERRSREGHFEEEGAQSAWEADVLPLNYTRKMLGF